MIDKTPDWVYAAIGIAGGIVVMIGLLYLHPGDMNITTTPVEPVAVIQQEELGRISRLSNYDLSLLATACVRESEGQSDQDRLAVISVIMNRSVKQTIETTLLARGQFPWARHGLSSNGMNRDEYERCARLAERYTTYPENYTSISNLSLLFFHNKRVNPGWPYSRRLATSNHVFYSR